MSVANDDALPIGKFFFLFEKKSSLSNKDCALNNPIPKPPSPLPKPPEKNGSSSNELNPLLPAFEEELFLFLFLPKNPLKKSSSNGFY